MDEPTSKAWSRPELIVIVRSKPEESVLVACKEGVGTAGVGGAGNWFAYCLMSGCGGCDAPGLS